MNIKKIVIITYLLLSFLFISVPVVSADEIQHASDWNVSSSLIGVAIAVLAIGIILKQVSGIGNTFSIDMIIKFSFILVISVIVIAFVTWIGDTI